MDNQWFGSAISLQDLHHGDCREDDDGAHIRFLVSEYRTQLYVPGHLTPSDKLQISIPIDQCMDRRMAATHAFFCRLAQKRQIKSPNPSQTMVRLNKALLALDAIAAGATQREIADVLYGQKRISEELWRTSSIRQTIHRLCVTGEAMMHGEYSRLLLE